MPTTTPQPTMVTLPAAPNALAHALIDQYDLGDIDTIARELLAALPPPPSVVDMLAEMTANRRPIPDPDAEPEGGWNDDAGKGLSDLQQQIMEYLWSVTQRREHHYPPKSPSDVPVRVPWHPNRFYRTDTASERAVTSRALRRLMDRGLVELRGYGGGVRFRADTVSLTAEGRRHARQTMTTCETQPREPGCQGIG